MGNIGKVECEEKGIEDGEIWKIRREVEEGGGGGGRGG